MECRLKGVVAIIVVVLCSGCIPFGAEAQGNTTTCNIDILQLAPCLPFVTGQEPTPQSGCCDPLESLTADRLVCVCQFLGNGDTSGFNVTRARSLPALCNIQIDEAQCPALGALTPSEGPTASVTPAGPPRSAGGPEATPDGNAASRLFPSILSCLAALAVGTWMLGSQDLGYTRM